MTEFKQNEKCSLNKKRILTEKKAKSAYFQQNSISAKNLKILKILSDHEKNTENWKLTRFQQKCEF
jgi:hypothetical protein